MFDLARGADRGRVSHVYGEWEAVAFGPRGIGLAVSNDDGAVRIHDLRSRRRRRRMGKLKETATVLAFNPQGTLLAVGGMHGRIKIWDVATEAVIFDQRHGRKVHSLSFTADGTRLASAAAGDSACREQSLDRRRHPAAGTQPQSPTLLSAR
jgi:WD40 repeat protein